MRKLRSRATISLLLAAALLVGLAFYIVRYARSGRDWALSPINATYYSAGKLCVGTLTDRNGVVLASAENGERRYAEDAQTRISSLHAVGDQQGYIGSGALRLEITVCRIQRQSFHHLI